MNNIKKVLYSLAVAGLLLPVPFYSASATENSSSSSSTTECRLIMKTAKEAFKTDMKAIEKMYNDSILAAYQTYKSSEKTTADLATLIAAKKSAQETKKTYEKAAKAKLAAATVGDCVSTDKKEHVKLVKACIKDAKSETKDAVKAAKEEFKANKEGMDREELKAARKALESKIKELSKSEKESRKACKDRVSVDSTTNSDQTDDNSDDSQESENETEHGSHHS